MTPIQLHTYQTPNGHKASIMLEETGLPYRVHIVDIEANDQRKPEFVALNPNSKIPVIVDPDRDRTIVESGAILSYLADRSGVLKPADDDERLATLQWVLFQASHIRPTLGQLWNWKVFAAEKIPPVIDRFEREAGRLFTLLDRELAERQFLVSRYGVADVMTWPWVHAGVTKIGLSLDTFSRLGRWYDEIAERPAVQRGLAVPVLGDHNHVA